MSTAEVGDECYDDFLRQGGRRRFCLRDKFEFAFVGTVRNGTRFQDDGLNGDDKVSTTNDDLCFGPINT